MVSSHWLRFAGFGAFVGWLCFMAPVAVADEIATATFCTDLDFKDCKTSFTPGETIFVRFTFKRSVEDAYKENLDLKKVPVGSALAIGISKDIDTDPIVTVTSKFLADRYNKQKTLDFVMQGDDQTMELFSSPDIDKRIPFNSVTTMSNTGLKDQWLMAAARQPDGEKQWEIFLIFTTPDGTTLKLSGKGKFSYKITSENRHKISDAMNFYDKQNFEKTPDDGISTDLHKNNIGKITFSNKKMVKDFKDESSLKTEFGDPGKGIYARMYLKQSVRNFFADMGYGKDVGDTSYDLTITVDDTISRTITDKLSKDEAHKLTSWSIVLAPTEKDHFADSPIIIEKFAYLMSMQKPGKHKVRLEAFAVVGIDQKISMASGEFTITVDAKSRDKFAKTYGHQMPDKGLLKTEKGLDKEVQAIAGKDAAYRAPYKWEIHKNAFGVIIDRTTTVFVGYKEDDQCRLGEMTIIQIKNDKGYEKATISGRPWQAVYEDLPCQNLTK